MALLVWTVLLLSGLTCCSSLSKPISIQSHPSIVQIEKRVRRGSSDYRHRCVGTLITSLHVLSAADNLYFHNKEDFRIRGGAEILGEGGHVVGVKHIIIHEDFHYDMSSKDADLCIIRAKEYMPLGSAIWPAPIVPQNFNFPPQVDVNLVHFRLSMNSLERHLHNQDLVSISSLQCRERIRTLTKNMLCVGLTSSDKFDPIVEDHGAPVFYHNILLGIVSHGRIGGPLVATSIASYSNWIVGTVDHYSKNYKNKVLSVSVE